jgi:hypothetical protein
LIPGGGWVFFSSPPRPDRLWGPPSFLYNRYGGGGLTTHLLVVPRSKNAWSYTSIPHKSSWRGA